MVHEQQRYGGATTRVNQSVMHAGYTLNCMVLIGRLRCERMGYKRVKENRRKVGVAIQPLNSASLKKTIKMVNMYTYIQYNTFVYFYRAFAFGIFKSTVLLHLPVFCLLIFLRD